MKITYEITRYNGIKSYDQSYTFEADESRSILWGLEYIKEHLDPTLTFSAVCRAAVCGACAVKVNGIPRLACEILIKKVAEEKGPVIKIKPLDNFTVLRDLVTDWEDSMRHMKAAQTWISPADSCSAEESCVQSPKNFQEIQQKINCILCGSCVSACPMVRTKGERFLEPFLFTKLARYAADEREKTPAAHVSMAEEKGLAFCIQCKACTRVCPKGVDPAGDILELRESNKK